MMTLSFEYFCRFQPLASCGFVAVTVTSGYCCQNAKIQKSQIISVMFTSCDIFYLSVQFDHANCGQLQIFASILRSSFFSARIFASSISLKTHRDRGSSLTYNKTLIMNIQSPMIPLPPPTLWTFGCNRDYIISTKSSA